MVNKFKTKNDAMAGMWGMTKGKMANYLAVRAVIEALATLDANALSKIMKYYKVDDPNEEIAGEVYNQLLNFTYILDNMTELPTLSFKGSNTFLSVFDDLIPTNL